MLFYQLQTNSWQHQILMLVWPWYANTLKKTSTGIDCRQVSQCYLNWWTVKLQRLSLTLLTHFLLLVQQRDCMVSLSNSWFYACDASNVSNSREKLHMWHSSAEKLLTFQNWTRTTKKRHTILNIHDKHAYQLVWYGTWFHSSQWKSSLCLLENSELI